jgi:hypothetical protein
LPLRLLPLRCEVKSKGAKSKAKGSQKQRVSQKQRGFYSYFNNCLLLPAAAAAGHIALLAAGCTAALVARCSQKQRLPPLLLSRATFAFASFASLAYAQRPCLLLVVVAP